jgi:hypothetical protein
VRGHEVGGASTSRSSAVQLDNARGVAKKMRVGAGGRATRTRDHDDDDRVSDECLLKYEGCHGFRVSGRCDAPPLYVHTLETIGLYH